MCGGPTKQQKEAATSQSQLDQQLSQMFQTDASQTQPFYENILANGIPGFNQQMQYSTSDLGNQIDQTKAAANTKLAGFGDALPSGFAEQEDADIGIGGAQAFDQNMLSMLSQNYAAKMAAAQGLNPLAPASAAQGGNSSIMQAPLQNNFWGNLVGGLVQGASNVGAAFAKSCWIAEVLYGPEDARTLMLRKWLLEGDKRLAWKIFAFIYKMAGEKIAGLARFQPRVRAILRPLFDFAWRTASAN